MEKRFAFTDERLKNIPLPPPGKRERYFDTKLAGLCARVTSGGITLGVYRWFMGKPIDVTLGRWPEAISLKTARQEGADKLRELTRGNNPNTRKRAIREEMTLSELFDLLMESYYKPKRTETTCLDYKRLFGKHLKTAWGGQRLSEITHQQIEALHGRIGAKSGKHAANNVIRLLRSLYNRAAKYGYTGHNPASKIEMFRTQARDRVPEGDEVPQLFKAIEAEKNETARDILLMLIYTGQRKSDVCAMRLADIDFEASEWRFIIHKTAEPHRVPLIPAAMAILEARKDSGSEFVFPGPSVTGHYADLKKAWKRVLEAAKISNLRIHDLRRFHGSLLIRSGASLAIVQKALGHRSYQSTLIYARLNIDPVRTAVQSATRVMLRGLKRKRKPAAKVTRIEDARKQRAAG